MTILNNKNNSHFISIAVDGTYNLNSDYGLILNMGYYDTLNNIPVELNFGKTSDQNLEVNKFKEQVLMDLASFKDVIFICDRLYFTYDLLEFLILHNLKFIIRCKGEGDYLNSIKNYSKNHPKFDLINKIKSDQRIIKSNEIVDLTITVYKGKKKEAKNFEVTKKTECVIVTNLKDSIQFPNERILDLYKTRWKIDNTQIKCDIKINNSQLINGIFNQLLSDILNSKLEVKNLDTFCGQYIKITKNQINRKQIRTSKTPFTKWVVKAYASDSKILKVIDVIINNKIRDHTISNI
jgi:hypothetical protein